MNGVHQQFGRFGLRESASFLAWEEVLSYKRNGRSLQMNIAGTNRSETSVWVNSYLGLGLSVFGDGPSYNP